MGIIQCSQDCKYQIDGYCNLDFCAPVNSLNGECPHFLAASTNKGNGFAELSYTDKL